MANSRAIAGTVYLKADSQQFTVKGSVECPLVDFVREPVESLDNTGGYFSEKGVTPYVKATVLNTPDLDWDSIKNSQELTVVAELKNGKVYTLTGAYLSGEIVVKADEGEVDLMFHGKKGVWS